MPVYTVNCGLTNASTVVMILKRVIAISASIEARLVAFSCYASKKRESDASGLALSSHFRRHDVVLDSQLGSLVSGRRHARRQRHVVVLTIPLQEAADSVLETHLGLVAAGGGGGGVSTSGEGKGAEGGGRRAHPSSFLAWLTSA